MLNYDNPNLVLSSTTIEPGQIAWRSPSNLAIIKYWGKYGVQLPRNPSISFTLANARTETLLEYQPKETASEDIQLKLIFDGEENDAFGAKVKKYFTNLLPIFPFLNQLEFTIHSSNSFPHSAGIASSASSMSALALCLCTLEDDLFDSLGDDEAFDQKVSYIARLGSGSACRSVYSTMAVWGETDVVKNSSNLYAVPFEEEVHEVFKTFHDDILIVSKGEKAVSSSAGHALMDNNAYATPRFLQANERMRTLVEVLKTGDLDTFGKIAEDEALTLHALMMTSDPSYLLMEPNSLKIIHRVRAYRAETKYPVFFSLDAGPNIHLLYPEDIIHEVRLFVEEELRPLCEEEQYIPDWVGEGPEEFEIEAA